MVRVEPSLSTSLDQSPALPLSKYCFAEDFAHVEMRHLSRVKGSSL
jgi:hypothetical protein